VRLDLLGWSVILGLECFGFVGKEWACKMVVMSGGLLMFTRWFAIHLTGIYLVASVISKICFK